MYSFRQHIVIGLGVLLCALNPVHADAQYSFKDNLKLQLNYHAGAGLPEYAFLRHVANDFVRGIDVSILKQTRGINAWEKKFNRPEYGLSFYYSSLGNNEILGHELALTYFVKLNLLKREKFRLYNRTGIGVGYVNKKFNAESNYLNVAVGSHYNIHFNLRLAAAFTIAPRAELNVGLSFDHYSNANTAAPNLGINSVTAFTGISYRIGPSVIESKLEFPEHQKSNQSEVFVSIGGKRTRALLSNYFGTTSVSYEFTRKKNISFHYGFGADWFYDSSVKTQLEDDDRSFKAINSMQAGIHFSQAFVYNKVSIMLQEGIYILPNKISQSVMYNRGIVKYQLNEKWAFRIAMKSHLQVLDYPEVGIGVTL